jgi:hypothetical protein
MLLTCILMYHAEMFTIKLNILIDTRCNVWSGAFITCNIVSGRTDCYCYWSKQL